jgi:hypothetical protein
MPLRFRNGNFSSGTAGRKPYKPMNADVTQTLAAVLASLRIDSLWLSRSTPERQCTVRKITARARNNIQHATNITRDSIECLSMNAVERGLPCA